MEALIGLVARQRGFINHLFGDALAGEGAAQRFLLSLPLVIAGSGRQLGWLPPEAAPFLSQIDNPEAARQRLAWALRGLRRSEGDPA